tara:strand:- start:248 stop:430 length:183 start_codon:yes stop_codon:yes gene_type:complete
VSYINREQYNETAKHAKPRLDLNDLLKRVKDQKKNDKKNNLLIFSGAVTAASAVILLFNL